MPSRHYGKWRARWVDERGNRRSQTFRLKSEAAAAELQAKARSQRRRVGLEPMPPKRRTFDELCEYWMAYRAPQKSNPKNDGSIIRCHLKPAFGGLLLSEVTVQRIDAYKAQKRQKGRGRTPLGDKTINNTLTLLISMLNVAVDLEWLVKRPKVKKLRIEEVDYKFLHDKRMIRVFLDATREDGEDAFVLYATAFYTGMRAGELAGLQWADINFDQGLVTVQRSYNRATKSKRIRRVPLLNPVDALLKAWKVKVGGALVFPNRAGVMHQPSAKIFQERFQRIQAKARRRMEKIDPNVGANWQRIVFHSCRHTFASHWMMDGGDIFKLQKILGHQSIEMTMRYAHLAPEAFAADRDRLGNLLPQEADVRPLSLHQSIQRSSSGQRPGERSRSREAPARPASLRR